MLHCLKYVRIFAATLLGASVAFASSTSSKSANSSIWITGENPVSTNFEPGFRLAEMKEKQAGAGGGAYMAAQRPKSSRIPYFFIEYKIDVAVPGIYKLWVATSPQNRGWASPLHLSIDGGPFASLKGRPTLSHQYGIKPHDYFGWVNAGAFDLKTGTHLLRFEVRENRDMDNTMVSFIDSLWLTQDLDAVPDGIIPPETGLPSWETLVATRGFDALKKEYDALRDAFYVKRLTEAHEYDGGTPEQIVARIMARPLPGPEIKDPGPHEFGVHGMEAPFIRAGVDTEKILHVYELLARVGVQSFRTAESCWHRLGINYDNFKELDYQVDNAARYGMTQLLTVGYPSYPYSVDSGLSAVRPEHRGKYKDYLERLLGRYAGRDVIRYVELANEVDAPDPWWRNSTPQMYVDEMKLVHEVTKRLLPNAQTVAFASTYARHDDNRGGPHGGRRFVKECFDLGIADHADTWSIHYSWALSQRDFPAFFRREEAARGIAPKPILNTEESGYGHPSDVIKLFARNFYIHDMPRVDYYLAQDWYEFTNLLWCGLFDKDWTPKPRLLAYAAAVDAMRGRVLVGMLDSSAATRAGIARPEAGINYEAYVLENADTARAASNPNPLQPRYAIVAWLNSKDIREEHGASLIKIFPDIQHPLAGLKGIVSATRWNLDPMSDTDSSSIKIGQFPVVIFCNEKPDWPLISNTQWLKQQATRETTADALLPGQG